MAEETCKKCGMPLTEENEKCTCEEETCCYHCCSCADDCQCGCQKKGE